LASNIGSELIVTIAWRSAEVAALAAALMMLIALFVRQHIRREDRLRARVVDTWRPLLTRVAIEEAKPPSLPPIRRRELPYFMEEWNALQDSLRGVSVERLNALAPRYGLNAIARRGLQSRNIGGRILAIRTLGHLRDASAWKELQDQLTSSNALVSFYAAAALVLIDATRAMPSIMNQLAERESWPGEAMARLLVDAGTDIAREPIRALMLSLAPDKVPALLPWLSHVDAVLGSDVATELLHRNPDHQEIAAAALLVVQEPSLLNELASFASSANAHIRENLAQALLKLRGMDSNRLEAVRASLSDPYARDMLEQACAEAALA